MSRVSPPIRRRSSLDLPARWPHCVAAFLVFSAIVIGLPVLALSFGDADDAKATGSVAIAALPIEDQPSPFDQASDLPDLLAAESLIGDNPTQDIAAEQARADVDALGNPLNGAPDPQVVTLPAGSNSGLGPLNPQLIRSGKFGNIPGPGPSGETPLEAYKRPSNGAETRQTVSIILGGMGINAPLTERAIRELPPNVSLSFAAHAPNLQDWINQARQAGHEVFLEIPMESDGFDPSEPGAVRALRVEASVETNRDNLHRLLAQAQGYAGLINYNGDQVLPRSDIVAPILSEVKASGLGFVADGSFQAPSLPALAQSIELPFAAGFGLIDPRPDSTLIEDRLNALSVQARSQNGTIGVGFVYPQTIDALKGWTATLSSDGLTLVPASAVLR